MRNINSLKNTSEFREVYEKGRSTANKLLVMYVMKNGTEEKKLGISVSKRVGNSIVRHRVIRIIRECFVKAKPSIPDGTTIVIVARNQAAGKNFSDLYDAFCYLLKRMVQT